MKAISVFRWLLLTVVVVAVLTAATAGKSIDAPAVQQLIHSAGATGPLLFIIGYALATVVFVPGSVIALAGGALFGPIAGALYSLAGATIGATLAFLVGRFVAGEWVRCKLGPRLQSIVEGVEKEGWRFVAFVRLVPLFPFNLVNYAFGLTRVGLGQYVVASGICMLPGALAFGWLGYAGAAAAAGAEDAIRQGFIAIGLLATVMFLPRFLKRRKSAKTTIDVGELKERLDTGVDLRLLDVRDATDFTGTGGHIPGAINIPLPELKARVSELRSEEAIAVYCRTDRRSTQAVEYLRAQGFAKALLVTGGMVEWGKHGLPVEVAPVLQQ